MTKTLNDGIMIFSGDGREIERRTEEGIALFRNMGGQVNGGARLMLGGVKADKSDELFGRVKAANVANFRDEACGSEIANAGDGGEALAHCFEFGLLGEIALNEAFEAHNFLVKHVNELL